MHDKALSMLYKRFLVVCIIAGNLGYCFGIMALMLWPVAYLLF